MGLCSKRRRFWIQKKVYTLAPAIAHRHVHCTGQKRQNVATAFQLFSNKIAKTIPILMPGNVIQGNLIRKLMIFMTK
jgi:hypothetical protein